jgi:hypothetical protein
VKSFTVGGVLFSSLPRCLDAYTLTFKGNKDHSKSILYLFTSEFTEQTIDAVKCIGNADNTGVLDPNRRNSLAQLAIFGRRIRLAISLVIVYVEENCLLLRIIIKPSGIAAVNVPDKTWFVQNVSILPVSFPI